MHNRILIAGAGAMIVLVLFLLSGAIPVHDGHQTVVFQTPIFLLVVAAGAVLMLAACFRRRPLLRQFAFVSTHAGFVLLLAGAFIDWRGEQRIEGVRLPVGMSHAIGKLRDANGQAVDLGFTIEVVDFSVSFYDPVYSLFRPGEQEGDEMVFVRKVDPRVPSSLRQIPGGGIAITNLQMHGHWIEQTIHTNGWVLRKQPEVPRWYEAGVRTTIGGLSRSSVLAVNHPVRVNGWQVSLVSYSGNPMTVVELAFKKSPGRPLVVAGIWCVIAGVSLLCLVLPLIRKEDPDAA